MGRRLRGKRRPHIVEETLQHLSDSNSIKTDGQQTAESSNHQEWSRSSSEILVDWKVENNPSKSSGLISPCDRRPHLQPISTFSPIAGFSGDVLHSGGSSGSQGANIVSNSSVIEILVHLLCREREPDHARRELLFKALCNGIKKWNNSLYLPLHAFPELQEFRAGLLRKFEFLFEEVQGQITSDAANLILPSFQLPSSGSPLTQLSLTNTHRHQFLDDRYTREFTEYSILGKGGFGVVVKAQNKLDGCLYAVKIIIMEDPNSQRNSKLLREVQALAKLSHPNIVRYHSTWLQMFTVSPHLKPKHHESREYRKQEYRQNKNEKYRININVPPTSHIKIQELSSSPEVDDWEESSGGIVFENVSRTKSPISSKKPPKYDIINESGESSYETDHSKAKNKEVSVGAKFINGSIISTEHNMVYSGKELVKSEFFHSEYSESAIEIERRRSRMKMNASGLNKGSIGKSVCKVVRHSYTSSSSSTSDRCLENTLMVYNKHANNSKMTLFIQMGLCGDTLANWILTRNNVAEGEDTFEIVKENVCLDIFRQILLAVQYIHSEKIIHRDLKPQNIFFTEDGRHIQLGDFGLARSLPDMASAKSEVDPAQQNFCLTPLLNPTQNTGGIGTPIYAAPELKAGGMYGSESDMHNLGIILLELFYPFRTGSERIHVITDLKTKQYLEPDFMIKWPDIASLILSLTHQDQSKRPTAFELLNTKLFSSTSDHPGSKGCELSDRSFSLKRQSFSSKRECVSTSLKNVPPTNKTFSLTRKNKYEHQPCKVTELKNKLGTIIIEELAVDSICARASHVEITSDAQNITRLERENKQKDKEILKLKEEISKLQGRIAKLEDRSSRGSAVERNRQGAASKDS